MKRFIRPLCLVLAVLVASVLTGCGKKEDPFQVIFAAPFVNKDLAASFGEGLDIAAGEPILYSGFDFNSEDVDPMAYAASAMMMTAMASAGEVDVMVCDLEEAPGYARGGIFCDLTEVFTPQELGEYADKLLTFEMMNHDGTPTGELTPPCGIDISGRENIDYIQGGGRYGLFLVVSTENPELAKEVFLAILNN